MELNIDTGVEEFSVNGRGVLRFNPADPNLYHRFFAAGKTLERYDAELTERWGSLAGTSSSAPPPALRCCRTMTGGSSGCWGRSSARETTLMRS